MIIPMHEVFDYERDYINATMAPGYECPRCGEDSYWCIVADGNGLECLTCHKRYNDDEQRQAIPAGTWSIEGDDGTSPCDGMMALFESEPEWVEKPCLRYLISSFEGNGFILDDRGSGSAGPRWVDWDFDADLKYGDVQMVGIEKPLSMVPSAVREIATVSYMSEWVQDEDLPGYEYRIYF